MNNYEAKNTFTGQHERYGDYFREWEIKTDCSKEETVEWCFNNLYKRVVPSSAEWHKNIRIDGEKHGDANYYFSGYYDIYPIEGGYKFIICEPFAD